MKVALVQHDIVWEDPAATTARVEPMIAAAAAGGAELVVLTEMFATGFSMNPDKIAEDEGGPTEAFLASVAARHDITLIASIAQRGRDDRFRNNSVVVDRTGTRSRYAKIHPFGYAGENRVYAAGTQFVTLPIGDLRVTLFICYDLRFADEFWTTGPDTDLFVVPANWPAARQAHWDVLLTARAIENQAYVLGVNRVGDAPGSEGAVPHTGGSALVDPLGTTLLKAGPLETVLIGQVDHDRVAQTRARYPFLPDRRQSGSN